MDEPPDLIDDDNDTLDLSGRPIDQIRSGGQISGAKYKLAQRADEQARLFPDLQKEIAERRKNLRAATRDQKSEKYKNEICEKVKELKLCPPEHYQNYVSTLSNPFLNDFGMKVARLRRLRDSKPTST